MNLVRLAERKYALTDEGELVSFRVLKGKLLPEESERLAVHHIDIPAIGVLDAEVIAERQQLFPDLIAHGLVDLVVCCQLLRSTNKNAPDCSVRGVERSRILS